MLIVHTTGSLVLKEMFTKEPFYRFSDGAWCLFINSLSQASESVLLSTFWSTSELFIILDVLLLASDNKFAVKTNDLVLCAY